METITLTSNQARELPTWSQRQYAIGEVNRLPELPSDLIRVALRDLAKVEKSDYYRVLMHSWHTPRYQSDYTPLYPICHVCLAGAVLAGSCGVPRHIRTDPSDFDRYTRRRLFALDSFRVGDIYAGCGWLRVATKFEKAVTDKFIKVDDRKRFMFRAHSMYDNDPALWRTEMLLAARDLKSVGF